MAFWGGVFPEGVAGAAEDSDGTGILWSTTAGDNGDTREGIVVGELGRWWCEQAELGRLVMGNSGRVVLAEQLQAETAVTAKWIAERLPYQ